MFHPAEKANSFQTRRVRISRQLWAIYVSVLACRPGIYGRAKQDVPRMRTSEEPWGYQTDWHA